MRKWLHSGPDTLWARPALPTDRPILAELLAGTWRRFGILAVEEQVALLSGGFSVIALDGSEAVGFLGLSPRASAGAFGECWTDITLVAVASDYSAPAILRRLLSVVMHRLSDRPSTSLVCLTAQDWLVRALAGVEFRETDRVLSYVRSQRAPLPTTPHAADLRPVASSEATTILGLNAAAFEPLWRYDERTVLGWLLTSDHAVLAHRNGTPQGFAITTLHASDGYAQLIRVATHPAARGQAIGRQLVVDAIAYAWEAGAAGVSLNTQASNVVAQNLYEDLGFRPTGGALSVMIRRL